MIVQHKCTSKESNSNMGCTICFDNTGEYNTGFFFDYGNQIKVGDEVKLERDKNGFYKRMWINGIETEMIGR